MINTSSITLIILSLFFASGSGAETAAPKRIVSLAPSITKSLYLLGAQDRLIAVSIFCPPEASKKEKIGTVYEPDIEKIVSLSPDLIIAAKEGNTLPTVQTLVKLGLNVYVVDSANNYSDICASFLALGKVIGEESRAREVIESNSRKLSVIGTRLKKAEKPTVFWQIGAQPIFTASRNSFVNDFIELAGGTNIFSDLRERYPQISREEVVKRDPDVIIMVSMGDVTLEEKAKWLEFGHLKAARSGRIFMLDDPLFTNPNPKSIADGVEIVSKLLERTGEAR